MNTEVSLFCTKTQVVNEESSSLAPYVDTIRAESRSPLYCSPNLPAMSVSVTHGLYSRAVLTAEYHTNICVSPNVIISLIPTINIASGCQETISSSADGKHNYDS